MFITKNFEATDKMLEVLRAMSSAELKKWIADKNFFAGLSTDYAKEQNQLIYEKLYVRGTNKGVEKVNTSDSSNANDANRTKRPRGNSKKAR